MLALCMFQEAQTGVYGGVGWPVLRQNAFVRHVMLRMSDWPKAIHLSPWLTVDLNPDLQLQEQNSLHYTASRLPVVVWILSIMF